MNVNFNPETLARLARIENDEGIERDAFVAQAVEVWSLMDAGERRYVGLSVMKILMSKLRNS